MLIMFVMLTAMAFLSGCTSHAYHDLLTETYRSPRWAIEPTINEIDWLINASGDSAALAKCASDTLEPPYFAHFVPDSDMQYYIFAVTAAISRTDTSAFRIFARDLDFDSLTLIIGGVENRLSVDKMLRLHWRESGPAYCGIEPIPIPKEVKSAALRVTIRVFASGDSLDFDRVTMTLPVKRKHLVHTLLNPWP